MSTDIIDPSEPAPYREDEEEIQIMDMDGNNLQLDEPLNETSTVQKTNNQKQMEEEEEKEEKKKILPLRVIEKLKVYIRDGPNSHHVENIPVDNKYYDLPTVEQLTTVDLTEENFKELLESLKLTKEDFRTSSSPFGTSRPQSLYVHGVNNMSTQEILNYFEEFQPIGIEWVSDQSCNIFWHNSLIPFQVLSIMTAPGPSISHRRSINDDQSTRSNKRKASSMSTDDDDNETSDIKLPPGQWREGDFQSVDKPDSILKLYLRYSTIDDRKKRGAENQSEYYRQYGNPNYDNMTGLISRSKKRQLNAKRFNNFRDFTVIKSNDPKSTSNSFIEETTTAPQPEDDTIDSKVKFTVVLPPKKDSSNKEDNNNNNNDEEEEEGGHRSKRQRRRSWNDDDNDREDDRQRKEKTHFTVTLDQISKHKNDSTNKSSERSKSPKNDNDDSEDLSSITDARQILERKRRNRK